jgi:predicted transposase/invertase (TIGR01784 family)
VRREKTLMSEKYTKGLEVGKAEGLAEGEAKGKAEGKAEVAKRMLKRGVSLEVIVEDTGLTYQELEQIKNMR